MENKSTKTNIVSVDNQRKINNKSILSNDEKEVIVKILANATGKILMMIGKGLVETYGDKKEQ